MTKTIALDFDGVICDSAPEMAETGWRCCRILWPEEFQEPVPEEHISRFCKEIRPYTETGYQTILQTKLMHDGSDIRKVTVDFSSSLQQILSDVGKTIPELKKIFGGERDRWLKEDPESWLDRNDFYEGASEALKALRKDARVIILTTKERRFVKRLMERAGIDFPEEEIFGLEQIRNKETTLAELLQNGPLAFVEDRLETLERVAAIPALNDVVLGFATWGYNTEAQRQSARANSRIVCFETPISLKEIL